LSTLIAIWLARNERLAAAAARAEDRERDEAAAAEQARQAGGLAALDAMNKLLQSAEEPDPDKRQEIVRQCRATISTIMLHLGVRHSDVYNWIVKDLTVVLGGVHDSWPGGWPRDVDRIRARHAEFQLNVLNWLQGHREDAWFSDRDPLTESTWD
jgi:hypothetical protein